MKKKIFLWIVSTAEKVLYPNITAEICFV